MLILLKVAISKESLIHFIFTQKKIIAENWNRQHFTVKLIIRTMGKNSRENNFNRKGKFEKALRFEMQKKFFSRSLSFFYYYYKSIR